MIIRRRSNPAALRQSWAFSVVVENALWSPQKNAGRSGWHVALMTNAGQGDGPFPKGFLKKIRLHAQISKHALQPDAESQG